MTLTKSSSNAKSFANDWKERGDEKSDAQTFWLALLSKVFGITEPDKYIVFEKRIKNENTNFIDGYIEKTHVLIEQKSSHIDLTKAELQSDKTYQTPYQQAKRYADSLGYDERARWIVVCNFQEFHIYDMSKSGKKEPEILYLKDLPQEYYRLQFLVDSTADKISKEMEVSLQAGELIGQLYDEFLKQYKDQSNPESLKSLNKLCVRLVFCLYAEDAGIFNGKKSLFHDYLAKYSAENMRDELIKLFRILNTEDTKRDPYLKKDLAEFPYVNGGLFADENVEIPFITEKIRTLLLDNASADFDWSKISPTIFGSLFESTLNPETRHSQGMHYTSIENIHKVIDPLFLDSLWDEFERIKNSNYSTKQTDLMKFQEKLGKLKFFDPACGSGNFLTETYISLRKLENEILKLRFKGQMVFNVDGVISVSIRQFYGIELNDFAVTVAKTALWIAESQMMKETERIVAADLQFLPLKSYAHIVEGNSLRIHWDEVVPKSELNVIRDTPPLFIMGNPPFLGFTWMTEEQKDDMSLIFGDRRGSGMLDYVCAWYLRAAEYMQGTQVEAAFVSTNSITQGEQVSVLWKPLIEDLGVVINFAYKTFKWSNEARGNAAVHCVIIGFDAKHGRNIKWLFDGEGKRIFAKNINGYLSDAPNVFISKSSKTISNVPFMVMGNKPTENGNLILSQEEMEELLKSEPQAKPYIKRFMMGNEFINNIPRYCIWLVDCPPNELRKMPRVMERVNKVRAFRLASKKAATQKKANIPMLFDEIRQPSTTFIAIPKVSSERRAYIPIGYLSSDVIAGDKLFILPDATLYHFGVITSEIHMAWMRAVCGRLKSDYSYSNTIVYNNFPWPSPDDKQKADIEKCAQAVLDARALYPESSLADLYDPLTMPLELVKAHNALDKAVERSYGMKFKDEGEIVGYLMERYRDMVKEG